MLKTGLSIAHFRRYVPLIEKETWEYFERWGDEGERSELFCVAVLQCYTVAFNTHHICGNKVSEQNSPVGSC